MGKLSKIQTGFSTIEVFIILIVVVLIGVVGYKVWHKTAVTGSDHHTVLADAKPQYASTKLAAGYLSFNASKFQPASKLSQSNFFVPVYNADHNINSIVFEGNIFNYGNSGLYIYNIANNTVYKIANGGSSAARIMSNHYVVYGFSKQNTDGTYHSIIVLNLQTGTKQTLVEGNATQLTGNSCCAVSPNGLQLAIPEKNQILIWNIQDNTMHSIPVQLDPFSANFPTSPSFYQKAPYYEEMNYPTLAWLNNTNIIYANHPPTSVIDSSGNVGPINNQLYLLNTISQTSQPFQNIHDGIYDVYVADNGGTVFADSATSIYQFNPQTLTGAFLTSANGTFDMYSPDGNKVFIFQETYTPDGDISVNVANPSIQTQLNDVPASLSGYKISGVNPESWISDHQMLIKIYASQSNQTIEWEGVYNTETNQVTQYAQVN